jgi:hypothetical protein
MTIKSLLLIFLILISLSKAQNTQETSESFQENDDLKKLVNCVNTTQYFPENLKSQILEAWTKGDGSIYRLIGELLLTRSKDVQKCIPLNNNNTNKDKENDDFLYDGNRRRHSNFDKIYEQRYNWNAFLTCLQDKIKDAVNNENNESYSVIKDLIDDIKNGNYLKALRDQFRLQRFGNNIISECSKKLGYSDHNNNDRRDHDINNNNDRRDHDRNNNNDRRDHDRNNNNDRRDYDRYNNNDRRDHDRNRWNNNSH